MENKLEKYLDQLFVPYENINSVRELREELHLDLQDKFNDLKSKGYDDDTAYNMTIDSIGDISEIINNIAAKTKELHEVTSMDYSKVDLRNSDLKAITVHDGKFNASDLRNSDFSDSNLSKSSFKYCDLRNTIFNGADLSGAIMTKSDLRDSSFSGSILNNTDFSYSDLSGVNFDNQVFNGTIFKGSGLKETSFRNAVFHNVYFKWTEVKKTVFDGATMDRLTYAILKSGKADLSNVTLI